MTDNTKLNETIARLKREQELAAARALLGEKSLVERVADHAAAAAITAQKAREVANDAAALAKQAADDPAAAAKTITRVAVREVTKAALKGGRATADAVVAGIVEAQEEMDGGKPEIIDASAAPADLKPTGSWVQRQMKSIDDTVADLANSKTSLGRRAFWYGLKKSFGILHWMATTYPWVLRPFAWAAHKVRDGLDRKIEMQGAPATNYQKLRRRLYSLGPSDSIVAQFRNAAVNLFMAATLAVGIVDAGYLYGTREVYPDVKITEVFRAPNNGSYLAEVHGVQTMPDGQKQELFFELDYNLMHYKLWQPQYRISGISVGDYCTIQSYGTSKWIPITIRQALVLNPKIIDVDCQNPSIPHSSLPARPTSGATGHLQQTLRATAG